MVTECIRSSKFKLYCFSKSSVTIKACFEYVNLNKKFDHFIAGKNVVVFIFSF